MELLKPRYMLDKYRIDRRIARGAFANVYRAHDTIEGVRVALKIPHPHLMTERALGDFRHEVRVMARLDHPNILPIKNASFIGERFVIVYPLGEQSLAERLTRRMSLRMMVSFAEQMLSALAHAHARRIIHCDVKPENFILFPENRLRLADFEIAKIAMRTVRASGEGTIGYVAPEQAMGRPTFQSDVFSVGLILYRMMSGTLPEWPYDWPPPAFERLRRQHPDVIGFLRRALEIAPERRFPSAVQMLAELRRLKPRVLNHAPRRRRRAAARAAARDWKELRLRQFSRRFGRVLETRHACRRCGGPVSEAMTACPWCATHRDVHREGSRFPATCPRCHRGMKLDWRFCPWCYGGEVGPRSDREYTDVRYAGRCSNASCPRGRLMPFMRYCPWCRRKVHRSWKIEGTSDRCASCGWGVAGAYWDFCPWCASRLDNRVTRSRA